MAYQGDMAVTLPNLFGTPGQALQGVVANQRRERERQYEIDYRNQRDADSDRWRKMNLIQDLTDLSKYKTGSATADGLANRLMSDVFQKYTTGAAALSPEELQAGVQKEMQGIIGGIGALRSELEQADQMIDGIKKIYPDLDAATLYDIYRKDVVDRHLSDTGGDFRSPMEIKPSTLDLADPRFLSRFISGNKNLRESVINPKGTDPTNVFVGSPEQYTKFTGKLTPWMKPNFDPEKLNAGFLPKGAAEPMLELKSEEVPLPAGQNGQPFRVVTQDVYDLFRNDGRSYMEVISGARQMVPGYDNLSEEEKQLAERKFLHDFIKNNDRSAFYPSDVRAAPRTSIRVSGGGSGSKEVTINDVWSEIWDVTENPTAGVWGKDSKYNPVTDLSPEAKDVVLKMARSWTGINDLAQDEIGVKRQDGQLIVVDSNGKLLGRLPKKSVNIKTQTGKKEKDKVVKQGNTTPTSNNDPLKLF